MERQIRGAGANGAFMMGNTYLAEDTPLGALRLLHRDGAPAGPVRRPRPAASTEPLREARMYVTLLFDVEDLVDPRSDDTTLRLIDIFPRRARRPP